MRALQFSILAAICLLFSAAFAQQTATQPPSQNAVAQWEPFFDFDGELYPSVVLAMSGRTMKTPGGKNYFGDPLGFAEVKIRPAVPNAQAHVEIQIEGVSQTSALDVTLPEAGQDYRIAPLLRYDYSRLAATEQSIPATVTYSVKVNGSDLGQQTRSIRIRSVNDVPFELEHGSAPESVQEVSIPSQVVAAGRVTLDVHYHGVINDPPRDPRHLRFVTPSETAGISGRKASM